MGRPSLAGARRAELLRAFVRVLGTSGRAGATVVAIANEAGVAPGLVHHYFANKDELYGGLLASLVRGFRARIEDDSLEAYVDAALALDARSDVVAARAWVGLFGEALSNPALFQKVRRALEAEVAHVERRGGLAPADASAVVAFVIGALVFGAFAPRKAAGFAAPRLRRWIAALR